MNGSPRHRMFDRFAPIVIGLIVLPAVGVAGYCWIEGWSLLDALYMIVTSSVSPCSQARPPMENGTAVHTVARWWNRVVNSPRWERRSTYRSLPAWLEVEDVPP